MPLGYALQNSVDELRVRKVDIELDSFTVKKQASIENAWLSRREARPGERVDLMIEVAGDAGSRTKHKVTTRFRLARLPERSSLPSAMRPPSTQRSSAISGSASRGPRQN